MIGQNSVIGINGPVCKLYKTFNVALALLVGAIVVKVVETKLILLSGRRKTFLKH